MHTILAVDDEPHVLKIMRAHLEDVGYRVIVAATGEEALALLDQKPEIDLVLLDRTMPGIDGIAVLQQLKHKSSRHRHIPVIMQTAKVQDYDAYEGIDAGAINYMAKPYSRELLLATVENVLRDMDALKARYATSP